MKDMFELDAGKLAALQANIEGLGGKLVVGFGDRTGKPMYGLAFPDNKQTVEKIIGLYVDSKLDALGLTGAERMEKAYESKLDLRFSILSNDIVKLGGGIDGSPEAFSIYPPIDITMRKHAQTLAENFINTMHEDYSKLQEALAA